MERYLVDDLKEYERLHKMSKDRFGKDWYRVKIQQTLQKIISSLIAFSSAMENKGKK